MGRPIAGALQAPVCENTTNGRLQRQIGNTWINLDTYGPIFKNTFLNAKKTEKGCTDTSPCSMCVHKVSHEKDDFFCGLCKEDKKLCGGTLFRSTKICLFCGDKTKRHFFTKLYVMHTHLHTVCVKFSFEFFDILKHD